MNYRCPNCNMKLGNEKPIEGFFCSNCGQLSESAIVEAPAKYGDESDFAEVCNTCKFWFEYSIHSRLSKHKDGECRRYAPWRTTEWGILNPMGPASEEIRPAIHPATNKNHWCGEHKFKGTG